MGQFLKTRPPVGAKWVNSQKLAPLWALNGRIFHSTPENSPISGPKVGWLSESKIKPAHLWAKNGREMVSSGSSRHGHRASGMPVYYQVRLPLRRLLLQDKKSRAAAVKAVTLPPISCTPPGTTASTAHSCRRIPPLRPHPSTSRQLCSCGIDSHSRRSSRAGYFS